MLLQRHLRPIPIRLLRAIRPGGCKREGKKELSRFLLNGGSLDSRYESQGVLLDYLITSDNYMDWLLEEGHLQFPQRGHWGVSPMVVALQKQPGMLAKMVRAGADVNSREAWVTTDIGCNDSLATSLPLLHQVLHAKLSVSLLHHLVYLGADVDQGRDSADARHLTPFLYACVSRRLPQGLRMEYGRALVELGCAHHQELRLGYVPPEECPIHRKMPQVLREECGLHVYIE